MSEWQPIETAPKDGTHIIVGSDGWSSAAYYHDGSDNYWKLSGFYDLTDVGNISWAKPNDHATHWQPLPKPPQP